MLTSDMEKLYPSAKTLVKECVASRVLAKDASLYDFSDSARETAENFMGWVDLGMRPQCDLAKVQRFADDVVASGIKTVVLIGQGGSTQAPMTITKYNKSDTVRANRVSFKTLDSDSPVRMRELLADCDPATTLVIVSSKSAAPSSRACSLPRCAMPSRRRHRKSTSPNHLVAITDPGSQLERQAHEEGWLAVFNGEPTVGGRFSALSIFGLLPAALAGIDLEQFIAHAKDAEERCSEDSIDNPAINLAAFLYDNYLKGRNKFSFLTPKRGRVLGLWIEQLVAESLGKEGQGILPEHRGRFAPARARRGRPQRHHVPDEDRLVGRAQELRDEPRLYRPGNSAPELQDRFRARACRALCDVGIRYRDVRLSHARVPLRSARCRLGEG